MPLIRLVILLALVFSAAGLSVTLGLFLADLAAIGAPAAMGAALVGALVLRALVGRGAP